MYALPQLSPYLRGLVDTGALTVQQARAMMHSDPAQFSEPERKLREQLEASLTEAMVSDEVGASVPQLISREQWVPDHHAPGCGSCRRNFTLLRRRHHCRLCGDIFCARCTTTRLDICRCLPSPSTVPTAATARPPTHVRVCDTCMSKYYGSSSSPLFLRSSM